MEIPATTYVPTYFIKGYVVVVVAKKKKKKLTSIIRRKQKRRILYMHSSLLAIGATKSW
jgi:hypothetical protein